MADADLRGGQRAGTVQVDRRFLLFQIDTSDAEFMRTFGGRDPYTAQNKQDLPGAFRVIDPLEWEDPKTPTYWRNILAKTYIDDVNEQWRVFRTNFLRAALAGKIRLRSAGGSPFRDITPLVRQVNGYTVSLDAFNNNLTVVLGPDSVNTQNPGRFVSFGATDATAGQSGATSPSQQAEDLVNADIAENDVVMVRASRDGGQTYELEFLGFVGKVSTSKSYGEVLTKTVQVFGISKLFAVSTVIKQQSIQDRFTFGVSISSQETPANYEHRFQGLTAKQVFSLLLSEVLTWQQYPKPTGTQVSQTPSTGKAQNPNATLYRLDENNIVPRVSGDEKSVALLSVPEQLAALQRDIDYKKSVLNEQESAQLAAIQQALALGAITGIQAAAQSAAVQQDIAAKKAALDAQLAAQSSAAQQAFDTALKAFETFSFQFNVFTLMTLLLMAKTKATGQPLWNQKDPKTKVSENLPSLLDKSALAVIEHGDHKVWNELVASGYENFFSQTATPDSIFGELRETTLYDVFESRDGTIVARPPRYNRIEISLDEYRRQTADLENGIRDIFVFRTDDPRHRGLGARYEFNPDADFVIPAWMTQGGIDSTREDFNLETRVDTKFTMPLVGPQDFPAGDYTDPNLLVKYGLRTQGPVDNPNATNENLAKLFSPVILGMLNAKTRKTTVTAVDLRAFRIGKLYYLDELGLVGFLVSDEILPNYGQVPKHSLELSMVRQVVWVAIADIIDTDNAVLDFAMTYLSEPPAELTPDPEEFRRVAEATGGRGSATPETVKQNLLRRGRDLLAAMANADGVGLGAKVPVFRYIPNILDVIVHVETDPDVAVPNRSNDDEATQAEQDRRRSELGFRQAALIGDRFYATLLFGFSEKAAVLNAADIQALGVTAATGDPDRGESINPDFPVKGEWGNYDPKVGLIGYGDVQVGARPLGAPQPYFVYDEKKNPLPLVSTPFYIGGLSASSSDWRISQLLINKLAVLDIQMKYKDKKPNVESGFPQYYSPSSAAGGGLYELFGAANPTEYALKWPNFSGNFVKFVLESHGANALFFTPGAWESPCFRIASAGNNEFRMPFGHIMVKARNPDPKTAPVQPTIPLFYRLNGGTYRIRYDATGNALLVDGVSKDAYVFDEAAPTAAAPTQGAQGARDAGTKVPANIPLLADDGTPRFCFLSPYLEPTVERMLEFGLPNDIVGYRKPTKTEELVKRAKGEPIFSEKQRQRVEAAKGEPAPQAGSTYYIFDTAGAPVAPVAPPYTGTATAVGKNTLTDKTLKLKADQMAGKFIRIIKGDGIGQERRITANTSNTFTVSPAWAQPREPERLHQQTKDGKRPISGENDPHLYGRAVDFALEALTTASQSDIEVLGAAEDRLLTLIRDAFLDQGGGQSVLPFVTDMKAVWTYPDGTAGKTSPTPIQRYFHVFVEPAAEDDYTNKATANWVVAEDRGTTVTG